MAMKKISALRRSSITHKNFVFTVEGNPAAGWETDVNPRTKRKFDELQPQEGFLKRRLRGTTTSTSNRPKSKEKVRSRLLLKNGQYNILGKNIPHRRLRFFTDFWNTLIDLNWSVVLVLFLVSLISSWLLFGTIFYIIALAHGDLSTEEPVLEPCFVNFESFASAFLYSVETMHTIGCCSALVGCTLEALIVGVVFAKFQMPAQRAQTLLFSQNAVISTRDGQLCLLFRIGNMRKSLIIQLAVRAHLVHHRCVVDQHYLMGLGFDLIFLLGHRLTEEGELMPFHQHELFCKLDSMSGNAFSSWPVTACHVITPDSPIYDLNKASLGRSKFELIVTLEGVVENTGSVLQARTSYTPQEIIWGHSFTRLLTFRKEKGEYVVDFNHFQTLEPVNGMLGYSAHELDENKSQSAPENGLERRLSTSPGLARSLSTFRLHSDHHTGDHGNQSGRFGSHSKVDAELIVNILKPPSPSLAQAVSVHTFESMQAMTKDYESNLRRFSRVSVDSGNHHHPTALRRASYNSSTDQLHRSSSPVTARRLGAVKFSVEPIEEDDKEVTKF